jgi:hypothetical protein
MMMWCILVCQGTWCNNSTLRAEALSSQLHSTLRASVVTPTEGALPSVLNITGEGRGLEEGWGGARVWVGVGRGLVREVHKVYMCLVWASDPYVCV